MVRGNVNGSAGGRMALATMMLLWGSAVSNPGLVSVEEMLVIGKASFVRPH